MPTSSLPRAQRESLQLLCRTLASSPSLLHWFEALAKLPPNIRVNAVMQIASQMRNADEDEDLIEAIGNLSKPEIYAAAVAAVAELSA